MVKDQELGRYIEQYTGHEGGHPFTVKVLRIGDKSKEEALIQVIGVDDTLDGKIYKYRKKWQNSDKHLRKFIYVTDEMPEELEYGFFHSNTNWGGTEVVLTIYLYDDQEVPVEITPKLNPPNLDPHFMYKNYLKQKESNAEA